MTQNLGIQKSLMCSFWLCGPCCVVNPIICSLLPSFPPCDSGVTVIWASPRFGIPIPQTLMIWESPSHITLVIWVKVRVRTTGDEYIIRFLGMGMPKTRECTYHCDTGNWTVWGDEFWSSFLCNFFTANEIKVDVSITASKCNWTKLRFSPQQTLKWPTDCYKERWIHSSRHQTISLPRSPIANNQPATNGEIVKWLVENIPQTSIWQFA